MLFESKLFVYFVLPSVCIYVKDQELWLQRIMARDKCSKESALGVINNQMPVNIKVKLADIALDNSQSQEELQTNFLVAFTKPNFGMKISDVKKESSSKKKKEPTN